MEKMWIFAGKKGTYYNKKSLWIKKKKVQDLFKEMRLKKMKKKIFTNEKM